MASNLEIAGEPLPADSIGPRLTALAGITMLDDLGKRPWRLRAHARTLADLHRRLHRIDAPTSLRAFPVSGSAVLHLDLHPGNVLLSPDAPVVNIRPSERARLQALVARQATST